MRARAWCRGLLFAAQLALAGVVRASHRTVVTGLRRMLDIVWHVLHDDVVIQAVGAMRVVTDRFARSRFGQLLVGCRIERLVAGLPLGDPAVKVIRGYSVTLEMHVGESASAVV